MRKAGLLPILLLAGCMAEHPSIRPLRPLEIPTVPYRDVATAALTGSLMYEAGCLLFRDDETRAVVMPVWPAGSTFNGTALLYHLPGKADQWVAVNQEAVLYGQPLQWSALGTADYGPVEHQCGAFPAYYVSSVRPAD
jgi:hypothetical protein